MPQEFSKLEQPGFSVGNRPSKASTSAKKNITPKVYKRPSHLLTTYKPPTNHLQTTYKPLFLSLQTTYKPLFLSLQTTYKPLFLSLQTTYKPLFLSLQTTYKRPPYSSPLPPKACNHQESSWLKALAPPSPSFLARFRLCFSRYVLWLGFFFYSFS